MDKRRNTALLSPSLLGSMDKLYTSKDSPQSRLWIVAREFFFQTHINPARPILRAGPQGFSASGIFENLSVLNARFAHCFPIRGEEANTWSFRKTLSVPSAECERCTVPVGKLTRIACFAKAQQRQFRFANPMKSNAGCFSFLPTPSQAVGKVT